MDKVSFVKDGKDLEVSLFTYSAMMVMPDEGGPSVVLFLGEKGKEMTHCISFSVDTFRKIYGGIINQIENLP